MHTWKISQLLASLSAGCQDIVFALLVLTFSLLIKCLMGILDFLPAFSSNSDKTFCNKIITKLTTQGCDKIVILCQYQFCLNELVTSVTLHQAYNKLLTACSTFVPTIRDYGVSKI